MIEIVLLKLVLMQMVMPFEPMYTVYLFDQDTVYVAIRELPYLMFAAKNCLQPIHLNATYSPVGYYALYPPRWNRTQNSTWIAYLNNITVTAPAYSDYCKGINASIG